MSFVRFACVHSSFTGLVSPFSNFRSLSLAATLQRCVEFLQLLETPQLMERVLPVDASCEDIEVDLGFLDRFVQEALAQGEPDYVPSGPQRAASGLEVSPVYLLSRPAQGIRILCSFRFVPLVFFIACSFCVFCYR